MPSGSVISFGSCSRPARSSTAYSTACCATSPSSVVVACRCVSVLVRPSRIAMVRRTTDDTAGSCVTISTVTPSSALAVWSAPNTSTAVAVSSSPVGSSASSTRGSLTSATAMAARCCSPPDIWSGRRFRQSPRPSSSSSSVARARRARAFAARQPHGQFHVLLRGQVRQQVAGGLLPDEADHPAPVGQPLPGVHRRQVVAARPGPNRPSEYPARPGCSSAWTCRCRTPRPGRPARPGPPAGRAPAGPAPRSRPGRRRSGPAGRRRSATPRRSRGAAGLTRRPGPRCWWPSHSSPSSLP